MRHWLCAAVLLCGAIGCGDDKGAGGAGSGGAGAGGAGSGGAGSGGAGAGGAGSGGAGMGGAGMGGAGMGGAGRGGAGAGGAGAGGAGAGGADCGTPLSCTGPLGCVRGRVTRFVSESLQPAMRTTLAGDAGVCVSVTTPIDFAPGRTIGMARPDACGRFAVGGVPRTSNGTLILVVDDCETTAARYATAITLVVQTGDLVALDDGVPAIETAVSDGWRGMAGRDLFMDGGTQLVCFQDRAGTPIMGAVPTSPSALSGDNVIYFAPDLRNLEPGRAFTSGTSAGGCLLVNPPQADTTYSGMAASRTFGMALGSARDGTYFFARVQSTN